MFVASIAEVVSIGAILPFLAVLTSPEVVFRHSLAQPLIRLLELNEPDDLLLIFTIVFGVAAIAAGVMRLGLLWAQTRLSYAIGADFGIAIYRRTLYQPYAIHVQRNSSDVIAGINTKSHNLVIGALYPVLTLASSALMLVTILATLVSINPIVAFSAFVGLSMIYMGVVSLTRRRLLIDSEKLSLESVQVVKALQEGLGGIRDVLIDGTQSIYTDIFKNSSIPYERARANIQIVSGAPRFAVEAFGMLFIATVAYLIAISGDEIVGAIPLLGALALGAQRILPVLQQAYSAITFVRGHKHSVWDALDLLDQELPAHAIIGDPPAMPFCNAITLNDIRFRYSEDGPMVLDGVSLSIPKGSRVGIIGVTGSGKSTLLDIVMGLLVPTSGDLLVDDSKVTGVNQRAWQKHIAHVPQSIFLSDSTIAENIAFGIPRPNIDMQRVTQAAEKAHIAHDIESLPNKYRTVVGERGVRLSGGQRQRIGIARALYKRADVIIFDEATSALDSDTERAVMLAINALNKDLTVIIIAHRLSTLRDCSQIVRISGGKINQAGTFESLLLSEGVPAVAS